MTAFNHQMRAVRVAVVGDQDTGKTSLISTAANDTYDQRPVPVLPPTKLAPDYTPERVPLLLTDTSAAPEARKATDAAIQSADAVVVCFDARRSSTLEDVRQVSETRATNTYKRHWFCQFSLYPCLHCSVHKIHSIHRPYHFAFVRGSIMQGMSSVGRCNIWPSEDLEGFTCASELHPSFQHVSAVGTAHL